MKPLLEMNIPTKLRTTSFMWQPSINVRKNGSWHLDGMQKSIELREQIGFVQGLSSALCVGWRCIVRAQCAVQRRSTIMKIGLQHATTIGRVDIQANATISLRHTLYVTLNDAAQA